jgi:hypothetical protein
MTVLEMHYDFRLKVGMIESLQTRAFTDAEIDWFLNESKDIFTKRFMKLDSQGRRKGFEMDQKDIDDLKSLVVKFPEQPALPLAYYADMHIYELDLNLLTHNYLFFIRGVVSVTDDNCTYKAQLKHVRHGDLNEALADPFNKSDKKRVLFNFGRSENGVSSSIYLYPDVNHQLSDIVIEYIKTPSKINLGTYTYIDGTTPPAQDCDLPEHTHNQIVDIAVLIASGQIGDPNKLQFSTLKTQINE